MQDLREQTSIENDLGTFEGFNHRTQETIFPNVTAQEPIDWDHDRTGKAEFWHFGDNPGVGQILSANHVVDSEVITFDRLLPNLV